VDAEEAKKIAQNVKKSKLHVLYKKALRDGEMPYSENRETVQSFVIDRDEDAGKIAAENMLKGMLKWKNSLGQLKNAAENSIKIIR